jgi:hypothetical protein
MTAHDRIRLTGPFAEYSESRRLFQAFETQNDSPGREPSPVGADHFWAAGELQKLQRRPEISAAKIHPAAPRFSKCMTQPARIKPLPQQAAMMFGEFSRTVFAARRSRVFLVPATTVHFNRAMHRLWCS